jgi:hypothetical protein
MTAVAWTAIALALVGVTAIGAVIVKWQATQHLEHPLPPWVNFACIGGMLALAGASCFAIAFLLGG